MRTTSDAIVERLVLSATQGRGLWIGLPAERSPRHELLRLEMEKLNEPNMTLSDETHVTIAHLGKSADQRVVEAAVTACFVISETICSTSVSVEGISRFRDTVVTILSPRWIDSVCDTVWKCLEDRHVFPDKSFAGIRHATVGKLTRDSILKIDKLWPTYSLEFRQMMVVCGDHRMMFDLKTGSDPF